MRVVSRATGGVSDVKMSPFPAFCVTVNSPDSAKDGWNVAIRKIETITPTENRWCLADDQFIVASQSEKKMNSSLPSILRRAIYGGLR